MLAGAKAVEGGRPVACLALCDGARAALVDRSGCAHDERQIAPFDPAADWMQSPPPAPRGSRLMATKLLRRIALIDPESLDSYREQGGFEALRRAQEMGAEAVIREGTEARLLGRGGAGFPTGRKWESVAETATRPHYLVCNADESAHGTANDRVLLE